METVDVISGFREDDLLRGKFYDYTRTIFPGADFVEWHRRGFWREEYQPCALMEDGRIVSNVSITRMNIWVDGMLRRGIQFGTVGTLPEYRGRGLSRKLMEHVMAHQCRDAEILFLYANETVVDFYTRFGFRCLPEHRYVREANLPNPSGASRRLDISNDADFRLITDLIGRRTTLTRMFGAENYGFITVWHLLNLFPNHIYYVEELDAVVVATERDGTLKLWDVITSEACDMEALLAAAMPNHSIRTVVFTFPPDLFPFSCDSIEEEETLLFIHESSVFPSGKYRFPTTAQT